uniref:Uncharacterized protein AlNc14C180G8205 n=1 Tax=Albugo laibachii Nc14 TaxID=890382 RepID=F0WP58_9STRA|nr:PREDICTED: hypothetical protein [Albugo laibachii Nc14]|eukprot:CCA23102.1 PREDICTED: hypothetical protein [Albugo laibachii Nc14]
MAWRMHVTYERQSMKIRATPPTAVGDVKILDDSQTGNITVKKFKYLVGSLLWLSRCSRPDISFAVHRVTRHTHSPTEEDWKLAKRIASVGYSDADFAADRLDRKSFMKKQGGVSLSTMEAECTAASVVVAQMLGLRELTHEIGLECKKPMIFYVDN